MIVVAGPSGSGKSLFFPVRRMAAHAFNVDDRAALLHGGYGGIPAVIRAQAQRECEAFVLDQITQRHTFAVETTLRSDAALRQAAIARSNGLRTALVYVCTQDVHENVKRVALRGKVGGHAAPAAEIRDIYTRSVDNLRICRELFDDADLYDRRATLGCTASCYPPARLTDYGRSRRPRVGPGIVACVIGRSSVTQPDHWTLAPHHRPHFTTRNPRTRSFAAAMPI